MTTMVSWLLGIALSLLGIAGFLTDGVLLVFAVDTVGNVVHLVSGLAGLFAASKSGTYAKQYLMTFGVLYGVVAVLGFATGSPILGVLAVNAADNYLHLAIAVVSIVVGFGKKS